MSKKSLCLCLSLSALLGAISAQAAISISVSSVFGRGSITPLLDSTGAPLEYGNRVVLGSFDLGGMSLGEFFSPNPDILDSALKTKLLTAFNGVNPLDGGEDLVFDVVGPRDGIVGFNPTTGSNDDRAGYLNFATPFFQAEDFGVAGQPIYLWSFKTKDNSANLGPNFSNVLEVGVFTSSDPKWVFPASQITEATPITIYTQEIDFSYFAVIPEPAVASVLLGLGALGFLAIRRRR